MASNSKRRSNYKYKKINSENSTSQTNDSQNATSTIVKAENEKESDATPTIRVEPPQPSGGDNNEAPTTFLTHNSEFRYSPKELLYHLSWMDKKIMEHRLAAYEKFSMLSKDAKNDVNFYDSKSSKEVIAPHQEEVTKVSNDRHFSEENLHSHEHLMGLPNKKLAKLIDIRYCTVFGDSGSNSKTVSTTADGGIIHDAPAFPIDPPPSDNFTIIQKSVPPAMNLMENIEKVNKSRAIPPPPQTSAKYNKKDYISDLPVLSPPLSGSFSSYKDSSIGTSSKKLSSSLSSNSTTIPFCANDTNGDMNYRSLSTCQKVQSLVNSMKEECMKSNFEEHFKGHLYTEESKRPWQNWLSMSKKDKKETLRLLMIFCLDRRSHFN